MIDCMRTHVRKQPIIGLYFLFETALKFYNLGAGTQDFKADFPAKVSLKY